MKTNHIWIAIFSFIFASCNSELISKKEYELVLDNDGILVEKFDSIHKDENKYNYNNEIFKIGTKFTYDFQHLTADNTPQYFAVNKEKKSWDFVNQNNNDSNVVKQVLIGVLSGNLFAQFIPDYNQTVISYRYKKNAPFSASGVIENEANIWIHPPRDHYFKILELNPFPYIKAPYEVGTQWTWKLLIGSQWGDERWKTWEGNIENNYQYEITGKEVLSTNFGDLECFVIKSTAKSSLGETALTAFFHPIYGFVKLDYTNINGSKTLLELSQHSQPKSNT